MDEPASQPPVEPSEPAPNLAGAVKEATEDMRVVLRERLGIARVKLGSIWHEDVPIVIAQLEESEARVAEAVRGNAVVLKAKATHAIVRISDELFEKVPLYQERFTKDAEGAVEEFRVRVADIRERVERKGFFGRKG